LKPLSTISNGGYFLGPSDLLQNFHAIQPLASSPFRQPSGLEQSNDCLNLAESIKQSSTLDCKRQTTYLIKPNQITFPKMNKLPSCHWFLNRNSEKPTPSLAIGSDSLGSA
jgi:hypothetical protein